MLPTSISEARISRAVITVSTIFSALVTCSICWDSCWRSKISWTIGEIGFGLPFGPGGMIAARTASRFAASSALIWKFAGSGLSWSWPSRSSLLLLAEVVFEFGERLAPW